jgi:hypothetical protein
MLCSCLSCHSLLHAYVVLVSTGKLESTTSVGFQRPTRSSVGVEVHTAVTIRNAVFCDIETQFVPHRRQYVSARAQTVNAM